MRVALVSPYSWSYPGGVTRHIQSLAERFLADGDEVRVLTPYDPVDRWSAALHRGARPQPRALPDYVIPLGRTVGLPANGAVSNLSVGPDGVSRLGHELRAGRFDVVHVHEPVAPTIGWVATDRARSPLVGTFHAYSANRFSNGVANLIGARRVLNRLHVRIAVSQAAAWTGRRFFGGHYRVIPNGVDLCAPASAPSLDPGEGLRIVFVGQAVERKGLPVLLRAFEALREHIPATLTVVGVEAEELEPLLLDPRGVIALGKVGDAEKRQALAQADVLCAPSLGGESFGMVLTEAFAAGTPVVASDIPGYRDVVEHGREGLLVPPGEATALGEALHDLWLEPRRRVALGAAAAASAERFAWPRIAAEVRDAYTEAIETSAPARTAHRAAVRIGALPADGRPRSPARRLPTLEPPPTGARRPAIALARRAAVAAAALGVVALAILAVQRIGLHSILSALLDSRPAWVLAALGLMCASMALRAASWLAILRSALPGVRIRLYDAMQGTFIGVLMSATLPARLGEPSRALVVARRTGRPREHLPVVLGTIVSQTVLNLLALAILGAVTFATVGVFHGHETALLAVSVVPLALLAGVLIAPSLLGRTGPSRFAGLQRAVGQMRAALARARSGLTVFRRPRLGALATVGQLTAWALQWLSCYLLLIALGLDAGAGFGAAAAVLFAVNVTAALPVTPSNLGVFQAACVAILSGAYGISSARALGFGIVLQAVEIATAVIMGGPALVKEGLSWKDVRLRALHTAPVKLRPRPESRRRSGALEPGA